MQNLAAIATPRGNRISNVAVTAKRSALPPVTEKPQPAQAAQKRNWRNSTASKVLRIPNELLPRVKKIVAEYRAGQCTDPDSWD
ncbi:MAG: hypothetical protein ACRCWJ_18840 [Casimicrobium sp.]